MSPSPSKPLELVYSARCFTARFHNLSKDDCRYRCLNDPEGLTLSTREGQAFLTINGIQTQSAQTCNLLPELAELRALGVDVLRARQAGREASAGIHWRGELLDGLYARAWSTQRHLPWTQHLSLLRDTLLALPDSKRASALPVLAGLRYLPNPRHPPLGVFFRRLLTGLATAD